MRITKEGTFIYCRGAIIMDGWEIDCEGGDVATHNEVLKLVIRHLQIKLVEIPELDARLESLKLVQRARDAGGL